MKNFKALVADSILSAFRRSSNLKSLNPVWINFKNQHFVKTSKHVKLGSRKMILFYFLPLDTTM